MGRVDDDRCQVDCSGPPDTVVRTIPSGIAFGFALLHGRSAVAGWSADKQSFFGCSPI